MEVVYPMAAADAEGHHLKCIRAWGRGTHSTGTSAASPCNYDGQQVLRRDGMYDMQMHCSYDCHMPNITISK